MAEESRKDVRMLLKTFGVRADEAIIRHLALLEDGKGGPLRLRCALEDVTDYGSSPPAEPLRVVVEGEIRTR